MQKNIYEAKNKEEAIEKALSELKVAEENLIINILEEKNTLLKKSVKIEVINYNDIIDYTKAVINEITKLMGLNVNLEVRRVETERKARIISLVFNLIENSLPYHYL